MDVQDRDAIVRSFQEVTQTPDEATSRQILESCNWDLSLAVNVALGLETAPQARAEAHHDHFNQPQQAVPPLGAGLRRRTGGQPVQRRPQGQGPHAAAPGAGAGAGAAAAGTWWEGLIGLALAPFRLSFAVLHLVYRFLTTLVPSARGVAPARRRPASGIAPRDTRETSDATARDIRAAFPGLELPELLMCSYREALAEAKRQLKFLVMYIHHEEHPTTPVFMREILCDAEVLEFMRERVLVWPISFRSQTGQRVWAEARATEHPCLVVHALQSGQYRAVAKMEAPGSAAHMLASLQMVAETFEPELIAERSERVNRELSQSLRDEQDLAFQESLRRDQEREEQQRREQEGEKAQRAREEQQEQERKARLQRIRDELPGEPAEGEAATRIVIRMPRGTRLDHTFPASMTVRQLYEFVECQELIAADFTLFSNHPKKAIDDMSATLAEQGLQPRAMLFAQDNTA